jgi:hypothetical protein
MNTQKRIQDDLIRSLVAKYGSEDWTRISLEVSRKTATQCRFRWVNNVYPSMLMSQTRSVDLTQTVNEINNEAINQAMKTRKADAASIFENIDTPSLQSTIKRIEIPPMKGSLGINVQEFPSNKGIGIVDLKTNSPFHGKVDRGDVIVKFMETSLRGVRVEDFMKMVQGKEDVTRYFDVHSPPSCITISSFNSNCRPLATVFTMEDQALGAFTKNDIENLPICFAFQPDDKVSQHLAETKQKKWNDKLDKMRKSQKVNH